MRRAPRPCSGSPLCPNLVAGGGPCPEHATVVEVRRGSAAKRGYGKSWHRARALYLRDHAPKNADGEPICEHCGITAREDGRPLHVDHIDGLGPNGPRGEDPANLQTLCETHHGQKTRAQTFRSAE